MAKLCVSEKTAQRQRWIEQGLQTLMLEKKFSQISVTDLCRHLDLSRRSFYRYFDNLEDVLNSLMDHTFENLAMSPVEPTVGELRHSFAYWVEQKGLMDALYYGGVMDKLFEYSMRYTAFRAENYGTADASLHQDRQRFIIGGFMALMIGWYLDGFQLSPDQMARVSHQMLYEPFLKK